MFSPFRKVHPVLKIVNAALIDYPTPSNISNWWNFGFFLGACLGLQLLTGIFLAIHYVRDVSLAFSSVSHIIRDVNYGWILRVLHANGASFFFFCLYFHVGRGIYYGSYMFLEVWNIGVVILLLVMATAFLGYVLPWGQIRYWGATVIINFLSAIPLLGNTLVKYIWGDYSVSIITLNRLFSIHFITPIILGVLTILHILLLHNKGSNNPTLSITNPNKTQFRPLFLIKDNLTWIIVLCLFITILLLLPNYSIDAENFTKANTLVTPTHIKPEWYYLFAYAILRAIPDKLIGIIALVISLIIIIILPTKPTPSKWIKNNKLIFWTFCSSFFLLSWLGAQLVEPPYIMLSIIISLLYFGLSLLTL